MEIGAWHGNVLPWPKMICLLRSGVSDGSSQFVMLQGAHPPPPERGGIVSSVTWSQTPRNRPDGPGVFFMPLEANIPQNRGTQFIHLETTTTARAPHCQ
eukprot:1161312-Pelagomonas_calceolata.AAC.3